MSLLLRPVRALLDKMPNSLLNEQTQGFRFFNPFLFIHRLWFRGVGRRGIACVENILQRRMDTDAALFEFIFAHGLQQVQHFGGANSMLLAEFFEELLIVGRQVHKVAVSGDEWAKSERAIVTLKSV